jgi:tRNA A37 threonylcarbamoyltransferase TsaD
MNKRFRELLKRAKKDEDAELIEALDLLEDNSDMIEIFKNEYLSDAIEELEIELDKENYLSDENINDIVELLEEYAY